MPDFQRQSLPAQTFSKRKSATKRLSDIRRRFSTFSPRNSIFLKPNIEKEGLSCEKLNRTKKHHHRSVSDNYFNSFRNNNKFEEIDFFDEFEENARQQQYTPIFTRNKSQMKNLSDYEEPTNEVILDEQGLTTLIRLKLAVKKFAGVKNKKRLDKEYQDGKTNPFE